MGAANFGEFSFLPADIDGFLEGLFFQDLLFVKMWHSLDICFTTMNLKAHLVVDNTMLLKFA